MAYCDYLKEKGYQGASATESWKSAVKMVFETVEPDDYEAISLEGIDLDDYVRRYQTLAGAKVRAETVTVYGRRIRNAIEAHAYYLEHGKPPSFKRGTPRPNESADEKAKPSPAKKAAQRHAVGEPTLIEFPFPLRNGQIARFHLPAKGLHPKDVDRMSGFLRSLQMDEQRQLPERAGEDNQLAA